MKSLLRILFAVVMFFAVLAVHGFILTEPSYIRSLLSLAILCLILYSLFRLIWGGLTYTQRRLREKEERVKEEEKLAKEELAKEERLAKEKVDREEKIEKEQIVEKKKQADEKIKKRIANVRKAEKLEVAQSVISQLDLNQLHLSIDFYGEEELNSLLREENESLNDSYVEKVKEFLDYDQRLNSETVILELLKEVKEIGLSFLERSLESDSFQALLKDKAAKADNSVESRKIEKNKSWDELKKEL